MLIGPEWPCELQGVTESVTSAHVTVAPAHSAPFGIDLASASSDVLGSFSGSVQLFAAALKRLYAAPVRRAARAILEGRLLDPEHPERGRWLRDEVDDFVRATWSRVEELLPAAELERLPTYGNRHNVFLAVVTTAAYQVLLERGVSPRYAATLVGDVGWKIYAQMLTLAAAPFRLSSRDPFKRMQRTLKALLVFPFSAPGRPGYEVQTWLEGDRFFTHWTHCPPQAFVRRLVQLEGDHGELDAFYRSWCLYDWPGADLLAGDSRRGHYQRSHTMSRGDSVCDMCWRGTAVNGLTNRRATV